MPPLTPMLSQYFSIKEQYKDCILFFRMGDFYEMFGADAIEASALLEITLTARHKGGESEMPMCGVPYHAVQQYLAKLTALGRKVAICEQVSDPKLPGLVERRVQRIVTPATTLDDQLLNGKVNNYLAGIYGDKKTFGFGFIDMTTGEFKVAQTESWNDVICELMRFEPRELIVDRWIMDDSQMIKRLSSVVVTNCFLLEDTKASKRCLLDHFKVKSLDGFGLKRSPQAIVCAGNLLGYIKETQFSDVIHINSLSVYDYLSYMTLDDITIRNLDIMYNSFDGSVENSLISIMDSTKTAMGGRLLRRWLLRPLKEKTSIEERLSHVELFVKCEEPAFQLGDILKKIGDLERLVGKIGCGRANGRDVAALRNSLSVILELKKFLLENFNDESSMRSLAENLDSSPDLVSLLAKTIVDEPPLTITEGGVIRDGYDSDLDNLRRIAYSGKEYIQTLQNREVKKTGISTLKIKFNKVFGYYIEISRSHLNKVPDYFIRKQTLVNAERFIIPELKEYEEKVLGAEEKIFALEYRLFGEILEKIGPYFEAIQRTAQLVAYLDVIVGFSYNAKRYSYACPTIRLDGDIIVKDGRHPVIERADREDDYIPNDITLNHCDHELIVLTGPNMSGKSSYLRQVALIVLMAQVGSFVPATRADVSVVDRIFTRIGASDNLSRGQSTFMVEMQEAANILRNATSQSLIILDEVGRGTSTYDGLSIAWAMIEYIYHKIGAKTLFATHYHELIRVVDELSRAKNYTVAVREVADGVVFLHQVIKGGCDRSYGIEVAKLAGVPVEVVRSARIFLKALEEKRTDPIQPSLFEKPKQNLLIHKQVTCDHPHLSEIESNILNELRSCVIDSMTPLVAMNRLATLIERLSDNKNQTIG